MNHRLLATFLSIALLAAAALAAVSATASKAAVTLSPAAAAEKARYLKLASTGIHEARLNFWNPGERWYNDRLNDRDQYPLATVWSLYPLFEAIDAVAMANRNSQTVGAVREFSNYAERYFNRDLRPSGGYAPYPGPRGANYHVWFDDNGWWGIGFADAYRVTHDSRYLVDAKRASDFVDARGWDGSRGMWWETNHQSHSLEALAANTALAAEIYFLSGDPKYKTRAYKYINWANGHAWNPRALLYSNSTQPVMTYVEGSMIGAHLWLCRKGEKAACGKADRLASAARAWWPRSLPNFGPQFDNIFFRYMAELSYYRGNRAWYAWARGNAEAAAQKAGERGLWLKAWDGSPATNHLVDRWGQIITHGSTVSLFAWLAAYPQRG